MADRLVGYKSDIIRNGFQTQLTPHEIIPTSINAHNNPLRLIQIDCDKYFIREGGLPSRPNSASIASASPWGYKFKCCFFPVSTKSCLKTRECHSNITRSKMYTPGAVMLHVVHISFIPWSRGTLSAVNVSSRPVWTEVIWTLTEARVMDRGKRLVRKSLMEKPSWFSRWAARAPI
jgi:hypothetical protein